MEVYPHSILQVCVWLAMTPDRIAQSLEAEVGEVATVASMWHTLFVRDHNDGFPEPSVLGSSGPILHWSLIRDFVIGVGRLLERHESGKHRQLTLSHGIALWSTITNHCPESRSASSQLDRLREKYESELGVMRDKMIAHADLKYRLEEVDLPEYCVDLMEELPVALLELTRQICLGLGHASFLPDMREGYLAAIDLLERCSSSR